MSNLRQPIAFAASPVMRVQFRGLMVRPHDSSLGVLASNDAIVNSWHAVARSVEVTASNARSVTLLERDLVLWRTTSGEVFAAADRCPHRQAPLSEGEVQGGCLVCRTTAGPSVTTSLRARAVGDAGVAAPAAGALNACTANEHMGGTPGVADGTRTQRPSSPKVQPWYGHTRQPPCTSPSDSGADGAGSDRRRRTPRPTSCATAPDRARGA